MLEIGFSELLLVAAIALVVLGPERLPQAVRVSAYWITRIRRRLQSLQDELEREIGTDEIRRQAHNEAVMRELSRVRDRLDPEAKPDSASVTDDKGR